MHASKLSLQAAAKLSEGSAVSLVFTLVGICQCLADDNALAHTCTLMSLRTAGLLLAISLTAVCGCSSPR